MSLSGMRTAIRCTERVTLRRSSQPQGLRSLSSFRFKATPTITTTAISRNTSIPASAPAFSHKSILEQRARNTTQSKAPFSTSTLKMSSTSTHADAQHPHETTSLTSTDYLDLTANRRSYYTLTASPALTNTALESILTRILHTVPSAFNSQPIRLVLATGPSQHKLWDSIASSLETHLGPEKYTSSTASKLGGFRNAHGTILFYADTRITQSLQKSYPTYAEQFPQWTEHSSGMHQMAAWTALEAEGLGANLQHYNPVADKGLAELFDVPGSWVLEAQLVFGDVGEGQGRPGEKEKLDVKETLKVFG